MATRTKLNTTKRGILTALAEKQLLEKQDYVSVLDTKKVLQDEIVQHISGLFDAKEMTVIKRIPDGLVHVKNISIESGILHFMTFRTYRRRDDMFAIEECDFYFPRMHRVCDDQSLEIRSNTIEFFKFPKRLVSKMSDYTNVQDAYERVFTDRLKAYKVLINSVDSLEEVIDVWPEATEARSDVVNALGVDEATINIINASRKEGAVS